MKGWKGFPKGVVGRGAAGNPKNRFEKIEVEPDLDEIGDDEPRPDTVYLRDHSRSIIARNDSPDVGFAASINPYRGCTHGCAYCLLGDTLILMADGTTRRLENIRVGDQIYGTVRRGGYRRYTKTQVLDHWSVRKPAYRVTLEDGTSLVRPKARHRGPGRKEQRKSAFGIYRTSRRHAPLRHHDGHGRLYR